MSALQRLKIDKRITDLEGMNPNNKMIQQIDLIKENTQLKGVRARLSTDIEEALTDAK